jgi:hypothetical protein
MRTSLFAVFAILSTTALACSATTEASPPDGDDAESEDAIVTAKKACTTAGYDAAFAKYKAAVDHSKARLGGAVCDEGTTQWEIASDLAAAVASCGKFEDILATSRWAQPARDALKGNLALPLLEGKLQIRDAAGKVTFKGLAESLAGATMYGPAPGVYGNISKIAFGANGSATLSHMELPDDGMPIWQSAPATFSIGAPKADGSIEITITSGGTSTSYDLSKPESHPELLMKPKAGGDEFRSMPSECEA